MIALSRHTRDGSNYGIGHRSLQLYFFLIFSTAWTVFFPRSEIYKSAFRDLPAAPVELIAYL